MADIGEMGDARFRAQYRTIQEAMRPRYEIAAEPYREHDIDYVYVEDRLLVRTAHATDVQRLLSGSELIPPPDGLPQLDGLRIVSTGGRPVPEAIRLVKAENLGAPGENVAQPEYVFSVAGICMCGAIEPEPPCCGPIPQGELADCGPCPPLRAAGGAGVKLGIADTGFNPDPAMSWLGGINTDQPDLGVVGAQIGYEGGHGRFVAGVSRCIAPDTTLGVVNAFPYAGATAEYEAVARILAFLDAFEPQILNVSAGTHTLGDEEPLGFVVLSEERLGNTLLVAAAGNDTSDLPFYPAAFEWAVGVGALAADWTHRAWFSNFGDWVDAYAPGETLVNAYHVGDYTYREPPRTGAVQTFAGRARWSGTSFAAPYVAGLIAAALADMPAGTTPRQAWESIGGVGGPAPNLT